MTDGIAPLVSAYIGAPTGWSGTVTSTQVLISGTIIKYEQFGMNPSSGFRLHDDTGKTWDIGPIDETQATYVADLTGPLIGFRCVYALAGG